jgi:hypothetical protein
MSTTTDLEQFYEFIRKRLRAAETDLSAEEALNLWRDVVSGLDEIDPKAVRAIEEAIEGVRQGKPCKTLNEFERDFRKARKSQHEMQPNADDLETIGIALQEIREGKPRTSSS